MVDFQTQNWTSFIESLEKQVWEKAELEDGWFKLRSYYGAFILDLSEDGQKLKLSDNQLPCQGRKPCLRWVDINFLVDIFFNLQQYLSMSNLLDRQNTKY